MRTFGFALMTLVLTTATACAENWELFGTYNGRNIIYDKDKLSRYVGSIGPTVTVRWIIGDENNKPETEYFEVIACNGSEHHVGNIRKFDASGRVISHQFFGYEHEPERLIPGSPSDELRKFFCKESK